MPLSTIAQSLLHSAAAQPAGVGSYLVVAGLLLAAYLPGRALAGRVPLDSGTERVAVCLALGLVAEATLVFVLGLAGWFTPVAAAAGLLALQLPALRPRRRPPGRVAPGVPRRSSDAAGSSGGPGPPPGATLPQRLAAGSPEAWGALAAVALGLVLLWAFLATLALYPPLGFDATLYHLPAARELVETGRLPWLGDSRFPVFPQLNEALFALALLAGDDRAARLVELALVALVALGVYGWVAGRAGRPWPGVWAAALWVGSPYVVLYGADAYVDVGLALFGFLSLVAADRWSESGHPRWAAAAGVLAGAAAAVKYQGLFFVALAPAAVLVLGRSLARRRRLGAAALALGAALLAAAPWYGRVLATTGNPVFPFFSEVFGVSEWSPGAASAPRERTGGEGDPGAAASRPWLRVRAFAWGSAGAWPRWVGPPPFDPWLLALAPAALLLVRRPRRPAAVILLGLSYAPCSWLFAPDPRYLLPALPWACAAAAVGLSRLAAGSKLGRPAAVLGIRRRRRVLAAAAGLAAALAFAAPGLVYAGYWIARLGPVPRSAEARARFLDLRRPGHPAIELLNRRHGEGYTLYAYDAPYLRYFVRGRLLGDWTGPHRYGLVVAELRAAPKEAVATLRGWGAGYLLLVGPPAPAGPGGPLDLQLPWPPVYEDASSRLYDLAAATPATTPAAPPPPRPGPGGGHRPGSGRSAGGGG